jgi:hypothetical protein
MRCSSVPRLPILITWFLLLGLPGAASGPRDSVTASYDFEEAVLDDGSRGVRLVVRLFFPEDLTIESAAVAWEDSLAQGRSLGSFTDVVLEPRAIVELDDRFALPEEEIAHLRKGGRPRLYLVYESGEQTIRRRIDLRRDSLIEEVES